MSEPLPAGETPRRSPLPFAVVAALLLLLCVHGGIFGYPGGIPSWLSPNGNETSQPFPAAWFISFFLLTGLLCPVLLLLFPRKGTERRRMALIFGFALLCRLALLPHPPSDDVNRYLWEGRLVNMGVNPYHIAPSDPEMAALAQAVNDPYHAEVNHPEMPAAYPPGALILFALVACVAYSPLAMKLLMIGFDLGTLLLLLALLRNRRIPIRCSLLYAVNPVILYAFAGQGHFDAMHCFFTAGVLLFYDRRMWRLMYLFAGLAVQSKYVAVLLLPLLIRRENLRYTWITAAAIFGPFLPFISPDRFDIFDGLTAFAHRFAFNGPIHFPLRQLLGGGIAPATRICQVIFLIAIGFGWFYFHPARRTRFRGDPVPGAFFAMAALLLLSPTVHFWYLSWIVVFLPLRPSLTWCIASLSISGYFVTPGVFHETGRWELPTWAFLAQWAPAFVLLLADGYLFGRRLHTPLDDVADETGPGTVSVVIPARNEAAAIAACIRAVRSDAAVSQVIVVDGGSKDGTRSIAESEGAMVILQELPVEKGGGRGGQIAAGIRAATEEVIAVVHADTIVGRPTFTEIAAHLRAIPAVAGGAVGGVFSGKNWRLRLLETANDLRAALFGISFGDQVQFFRRRPVTERGLYPAIPLMEDVELSLRLHRIGRVSYLFGGALISDRKWRKKASWRTLLVLKLFFGYLWDRLWGRHDPVAMYRRYYGVQSGIKKETANQD